MSAIPHITAENVERYTKLELLAVIEALQQQFQQQVQHSFKLALRSLKKK